MNIQKSLIMIGAVLCAGTVAPVISADEPAHGARPAGFIQSLTGRLQGRVSAFDRRREVRTEYRGRWSSFDLRERRSVRMQFSLPSSGEYQNIIRMMHGRTAHRGLRERGVRFHDP